MKKLLFLTTLFVGMAYAGIAFMSCSKDDDNTDSSSANLEGCWKLTKSVDNFSGEEQFGDNEGFIWQFDEANKAVASYEYDYEGQLLFAGTLNYESDGKTVSYIVTDPESGETMKIVNEIKKLTSKELVMYSNFSMETTYFKRTSQPELSPVTINKNQLIGQWQLLETWEPGDSKPEVIDPSEERVVWEFDNTGDLCQETTYLHGPANASLYKWSLDGTSILLYNSFDPNVFEYSYEIVEYGGTTPCLKIREWTSEYSYKVMKFKSMAVG